MKWDVISLDNKKVDGIDLPDDVFGVDVREDILARVVNWQLAGRRAGTRKTKTRSEIRGTTRKPHNQKGTGRARQGAGHPGHHRGGGIAFGPRVRSHAQGLQKKVRRLALKCALSAKRAAGQLVVLDAATLKAPKTAELAKRLKALGWGSALVIDGTEPDTNFTRAAANIVGIDVLPSQGANVYDILRRDTLVLTRDAVTNLVERLGR
jgi:large subunit ribosomal protein L4